jgi:outer membrane protein assembly factor BamB
MNPIPESATRPLRVWPVAVVVGLFVAVATIGPILAPGEAAVMPLLGGVLCTLLTLLWWLFLSRAPWGERLGVVALLALAVIATRWGVDRSIAGGAQGYLSYILGAQFFALALAVWAIATARLGTRARRLALAPVLLIVGLAPMLAIRTDGVKGGGFMLNWRWAPTAEELLLARGEESVPAFPATRHEAPTTPTEAPATKPEAPGTMFEAPGTPSEAPATRHEAPPTVPAWPGFRGPGRDGVIRGVHINTDWSTAPPVEMWRQAVGPGWSSFAVAGDLLYTQEQRGEEELVSCYRVSTGEPVWRHHDATRFWESNGGAGPRATPTLHGDRVYAFGATGILNALDAATGTRLWSRNVAADTGRQIPFWGFASSPLVVGDVVVVAAAGTLAAYDTITGDPRWRGPSYGGSYSSPHRLVLDGVEQVVLLGGPGAISVAPADGAVLWEHKWEPGPIVQPALTDDGDLLINAIAATGGVGTRRLHVTRGSGGWTLEERWTSNGLKPYFNDFVVHNGHAFGFDGNILASINLETGQRNWKGGRYGNGQLVLLADQDLLLVLSEDGELALVDAATGGYREVARMPALNAKTWNHPVIVGEVLLVRNGEEMAAYRLRLP